ncbi:hypothetical protein BWI96_17285 [Siphonobacter sp. SORGH_AS_0500]|uniref:hypothetical protein n=1 Tax=Siphonobacter sp. SORGH_AS_0500 TaxID=1864824 RepID=UPI000CAA7F28|nr:hypothetical protein [Siphonobacter sp. SORGH_AS_0500]PKK35290.1 hypothetical protein BWI96_17285 [Siphonobacter sp. SORGH_AS_0500]
MTTAESNQGGRRPLPRVQKESQEKEDVKIPGLVYDIPETLAPLVTPHYQDIVTVISEAWDVWNDANKVIAEKYPGVKIRNRSIGSLMSDMLRYSFDIFSQEHSHLRFVQLKGIFCVVIDEEVVIRFNLMDKSGKTLHTPTTQSKRYLRGQLPIPGVKPIRYLYAGYVLDGSKTEIKNVYLVERDFNGTPSWISDMYGNYSKQMSLFNTVQEQDLKPEVKPTRAKVRKNKKDNKDNSDNTSPGLKSGSE